MTTGNMQAQELRETPELDKKVRAFLDKTKGDWDDWNVPYADGQLLYDLIIENKYTRAVEIGTSTGHSSIWIAWALAKTGGTLITIEIDEGRYEEALKNFEEAGVTEYIDARLADAHKLVPELNGPFDFVFSDADKSWYTNYFKALEPDMAVGSAFTAHNTSMRGVQEYIEYVQSLDNWKTEIKRVSSSGMSVSYKTSK
jgi:predicted O-methyltransferase YrrM